MQIHVMFAFTLTSEEVRLETSLRDQLTISSARVGYVPKQSAMKSIVTFLLIIYELIGHEEC